MCGPVMINVQFVKSMCEARSSSVLGCHKRVLSNVEIEKHNIPCTSTASACALSSSECGHSKAVQSDVHIEKDGVLCTTSASVCASSGSESGLSKSLQCDVHSEKDSVLCTPCTTACTNVKEGVDVQDNFDDIDLDLEELEY